MGKYKDALKKAGWVVQETQSSTIFSSTVSDDLQKAMKKANTSTGALSAGTVLVVTDAFFVKSTVMGRSIFEPAGDKKKSDRGKNKATAARSTTKQRKKVS